MMVPVEDGLRVRLMGGLSVDGVPERQIGSRKARLLLARLAAARGETVPVEHAADALWGDVLPARPADQVGVLVSRLRAVIGADRIVRRSAGYALRDVWLDVEEVELRVGEAMLADHPHDEAVLRALMRAHAAAGSTVAALAAYARRSSRAAPACRMTGSRGCRASSRRARRPPRHG